MPVTYERYMQRCVPCFRAKHLDGQVSAVSPRSASIGELTYTLLEESEVHCLIDCCGLNAVELSEESLARWRDKNTEKDWVRLVEEYSQLVNVICEFESPIECLGDEYTPEELIAEFEVLGVAAGIKK
ncbi:hypothetical protein NT6N_24540 [Oceaniferula spumae]|uniref:Uncharacterized protein n=1 Tax=Oceaniferula spumae TaxID=2979115 RepID=A0AAT9FND7_9BACT